MHMYSFGKGKKQAMRVGYFLTWEFWGNTGKALEILEILEEFSICTMESWGWETERELRSKSPQGLGLSNLVCFHLEYIIARSFHAKPRIPFLSFKLYLLYTKKTTVKFSINFKEL